MSILSLCRELRRQPFEFLGTESAFALEAFFSGYAYANSSIESPLRRAATDFAGSDEMSACTLAYLASTDPKSSFDRLLSALEHELQLHGDGPDASVDVGSTAPLLDSIIEAIDSSRAAVYLVRSTIVCLFETLNGYWCGLDPIDPVYAERLRSQIHGFEFWLRNRYKPAYAPWYAILEVYEGVAEFGLQGFCRLFRQYRIEWPVGSPV